MDIIAAIFAEIRNVVGHDAITDTQMTQIEAAIRMRYGDRVVRISAITTAEQINRIREKNRRNEALIRAANEGATPAELSERTGLSRSQIYALTRSGF